MNRRSMGLGLCALLLAGCAAHGDLFQSLQPPAAGQSVVYILRTQHVSRSMDLAPGIHVNGMDVGALKLDGFIRVAVEPGLTEVRLTNRAYLWPAGAPLRTLKFEARAGHTHFVEFSVDSSRTESSPQTRTLYIGVSLQEVSQDAAMRRLPNLKG